MRHLPHLAIATLVLAVGCRSDPAGTPTYDQALDVGSTDVATPQDVPVGVDAADDTAGEIPRVDAVADVLADALDPPDVADDVVGADTLADAGPDDVQNGDSAEIDAGGPVLANRLTNGGFEFGETWHRPSGGVISHDWARTGDPIHQSVDVFEAFEGERAQKIWAQYTSVVPNDSEHWLALGDLTAGDSHALAAMVFTPAGDAIGAGNSAVLYLRYISADGVVLHETVSDPVDASTVPGQWHPRVVEATVPAGAVSGALGLRFKLGAANGTGSVYLDTVSWTSTGTGTVIGERQLVFNDEFDGNTLNEQHWTRLEVPAYTYNDEMQTYTDSLDNASLVDGQLVITARQEPNGSITSARLVTDGKAQWTYGRIEAMARVPAGVGTWPAFWMLPSDWAYGGWPDSGEIDIMEHVGCDVGLVHATVHTGAYNHLLGTQLGGQTTRDTTGSMHLYSVDWGPDTMVFSVDDETIFTFENDGLGDSSTWPFDQTFHVVLNLAFGGMWGGYCGIDVGSLPQSFSIDWVRVYQ